MTATRPIACTLAGGAYEDRIAWIAALNQDALRGHERRDLALDLRYAPQARGRVREMVRNEQACCSFLDFELREDAGEIRLTITAPEDARTMADTLFEPFIAGPPAHCACAATAPDPAPGSSRRPGARAAGVVAATLATGAVACGACCVLPFALPAAVLAGTGGILAWFANVHLWAAGLAVLAAAAAWGLIAWRTRRTRCKPATSTLA